MPAPEHCADARTGLRHYRHWYQEWRAKMGVRGSVIRPARASCPRVRFLAKRWQGKAQAARKAYERWHRYQFEWWRWLPPVWKAIIACETHSNFRHDSGTYQGAFGFHHDSWDRFRLPGYPSEAYLATPREQYEVALAIHRRFGFSGWGCA